MAIKQIPQGVGLYTDGSGIDAPPGAMRVADNVLMHRQGLIVPRPGFGEADALGDFSSETHLPIRGHAFAEGIVLQCANTSSGYKWLRLSDASDLGSVAPPVSVGVSDSAQMRGSLYVTTSTGLRKLTGLGSTIERAGAFTSYQRATANRGDLTALSEDADHAAILSDSSAAYRWVWKNEDANGYIRRSTPSTREVVEVPSSYTTGAKVTLPADAIYLHSEWEAGDALELYRTRNSGSENADPGEDYYLASEYVITAADITAGFITDVWVDRTPDNALGPALYTSVSQLGAVASKEQPPQGKAIAAWQRCMWLGDITERTAQLVQVREVRNTPASDGTGLCGDIAGTWTGVSGGDTLTGVSLSAAEWDCMAAGMWLSDATAFGSAGDIPSGTKVVSFNEGATTITLDATPINSGSFTAGDLVTINGTEFAIYTTQGPANRWIKQSTDADPALRCYETSLNMATTIAYYSGVSIDVTAIKDEQLGAGDGTFLIISNDPATAAAITITSSRPSAFAPDATAFSKAATPKPGAIAWSAIDEPEAWPVLQTTPVGNVQRRVLALTPLDNALIVWKEDGVFRVTGTPPSNIVVDELTASSESPLRLLSPQCVTVLGGTAYAWTDQGIAAVSEGGVQSVISGPIADVLRAYQGNLTRGLTNPARGFWLRSHPRFGLLILSVSTSTSAVSSGDLVGGTEQYVWSRTTGAWSRWTRADRCLTYDPAQDRMLACPVSDSMVAYYERSDEGVPESYVDAITASISATVATSVTTGLTTVTVAAADVPWTPSTCDVLAVSGGDASGYNTVSSVVASGTDWVYTLVGGGSAGSVVVHQGIACTMQWQAQQQAGTGQRWQELHLGFEQVQSAYVATMPVEVGGAAHRDAAVSTVTATITPTVTYSQPLRAGVPRACVRSPHFYPYAQICGAGFAWELASVYAHHTGTSRRVAR